MGPKRGRQADRKGQQEMGGAEKAKLRRFAGKVINNSFNEKNQMKIYDMSKFLLSIGNCKNFRACSKISD